VDELQAYVIRYSRYWNPAKEEQATHPKFKTFDLVLDTLLARKRNLAEASLVPESLQTIQPAEILAELLVMHADSV